MFYNVFQADKISCFTHHPSICYISITHALTNAILTVSVKADTCAPCVICLNSNGISCFLKDSMLNSILYRLFAIFCPIGFFLIYALLECSLLYIWQCSIIKKIAKAKKTHKIISSTFIWNIKYQNEVILSVKAQPLSRIYLQIITWAFILLTGNCFSYFQIQQLWSWP